MFRTIELKSWRTVRKLYRTRSWPQERRVIIKAEIVCLAGREPQDNPRFVVTNLKQTPQWIYEQVCPAITLVDVERHHITNVLEATGWRIEGPRGAACVLVMKPSTLRSRMAKLGIARAPRAATEAERRMPATTYASDE